MMSVILFGLCCAVSFVLVFFWAWWCYDTEQLTPAVILVACMGETAFSVACLVYLAVTVFRG